VAATNGEGAALGTGSACARSVCAEGAGGPTSGWATGAGGAGTAGTAATGGGGKGAGTGGGGRGESVPSEGGGGTTSGICAARGGTNGASSTFSDTACAAAAGFSARPRSRNFTFGVTACAETAP